MTNNDYANRETLPSNVEGNPVPSYLCSHFQKGSEILFSNIYVITNRINNKQYTGQSIDVKKRWRQHKYEGTHYNYTNIALYNAMKKYGVENFEIKTIESNINIDEINNREAYWIKELNTLKPNGYNLTLGGEGLKGYKMSDETKKRLSEKAKIKFNNLSDIEKNNFINRLPKDRYDLDKMNEGYRNWITTASDEDKEIVYRKVSNTKKNKKYDFYNFSFGKMSKEEKKEMYDKISKNNPRSQAILMLDEQNNIIKEFHSIGEAGRYLYINFGFSKNAKNGIKKNLDKEKTIYGYKWKHK